jgi:hypothetical protein
MLLSILEADRPARDGVKHFTGRGAAQRTPSIFRLFVIVECPWLCSASLGCSTYLTAMHRPGGDAQGTNWVYSQHNECFESTLLFLFLSGLLSFLANLSYLKHVFNMQNSSNVKQALD